MKNQCGGKTLSIRIDRSLTFVFLFLCLLPMSMNGQTNNPIPQKIQSAEFTLVLKDLVKLPSTSPNAPRARINLLKEVDDGSGRLFICDLNGFLYSILDGEWTLYLHLKGEFPNFIKEPGKGTGFGAFAFHPEFVSNGKFYTSHAEQAGSGDPDFTPTEFDVIDLQWVLYEWTADDPSAESFTGTKRELLRADFPDILHGFQELTFNPTVEPGDPDYGKLYLCIGDGGSSLNFLEGNLQSPASWLGSIFRIDPMGTDSRNGRYGIPPDNPFAGLDGATEEVWVYGFRNPHRITWDPGSDHKMLVGDIGEMNVEEVNILEKGNNYGWSQREGYWLYNRALGREFVYALPPDDSLNDYTYPVAMYDHDEGSAIVGGYVYRHNDVPEIKDQYLLGDIVNGRIFMVPADSLVQGRWIMPTEIHFTDTLGNPINLQALAGNGRADLRFGSDLRGNIYVLTKADGVVRTIHSNLSSSISDTPHKHAGIRMYPNPASDVVQIAFDQMIFSPYTVFISDIQGRTVVELSDVLESTVQLDVSQMTPGAYILKVQSATQMTHVPFVIAR